jgi:hypothetical protein
MPGGWGHERPNAAFDPKMVRRNPAPKKQP